MKEFLAFKEVYFPLGHMYHYISGCPPRASWTLDGLMDLIARFWLTVRNQEQGIYSFSDSKQKSSVCILQYFRILCDMD